LNFFIELVQHLSVSKVKDFTAEHVLRKIHHCTFRPQKLDSNFLMTFFYQNISIYPAKFPNNLFCHCINSLSSLQISIHCCTFCALLHV